jgi:hypothetical protein
VEAAEPVALRHFLIDDWWSMVGATESRKMVVMEGAQREGGDCDIGGPKFGEADDSPAAGGGWGIEGTLEVGIGERLGG